MDAVEYVPAEDGFMLLVRPSGWLGQWWFLLGAAAVTVMALGLTRGFMKAMPADAVNVACCAAVCWLGVLALLAPALQGAYRKVAFVARGGVLIVAVTGPLRRTTREYPRNALQAAIVGASGTQVMGKNLQQLKLYFSGSNTPQTMLTGRNQDVLDRVAQDLTSALRLSGNCYSSDQFMEVRLAPLHIRTFKLICGIAVAINLPMILFRSALGDAVVGIGVFGTLLTAIIVMLLLLRKASCPQCGAPIRRDNLSAEGYLQYTCPSCRILWQSPIRVGGSRR